jgi:hypothetical protein
MARLPIAAAILCPGADERKTETPPLWIKRAPSRPFFELDDPLARAAHPPY